MGKRRRKRSIALGILAPLIATVIAAGVDGSLASRSAAASVVGSITTQVIVDATGQPPTGNEPRGTSFHDTARLAEPPGLVPSTGTVTYRFFRDGTCTGSSTTNTVNILSVVVPNSTSTGALTSQSYSFDATYNGDTNYASITSGCEPFVVGEVTVTTQVIVDTTGQPPTGYEPRGTSFHDTATVTGASTQIPTGHLTYRSFRNDACTGFSTATTVSISGGQVPNSGSTGPLTTSGNYSFNATYSGDTHYASATSACEPFVVGKVTVATQVIVDATGQPPTGAEAPGTRFHDTATVTGASGSTPTGNVTYRFFANGTCASLPSSTGNVTISGGVVPRSGSSGTLPSGNYSYRAIYSGDAHYASATSACEPFVVGKVTVATQVIVDATGQPPTGNEPRGTSFHDTATVTGASSQIPTGTVTYHLFTNGTCTGFALAPPLNLTGGVVPNSAHTGPLNAGNYSYRAIYSGDTHYASATSACERFIVGRAIIATQVIVDATGRPPTGSEPRGTSFHDAATVTGTSSPIPTGHLTYRFFAIGTCNTAPSSSQTVAISAGLVPNSASTGPLSPGNYSFQVVYSGDTHYASTTSACEPFVVLAALPTWTELSPPTSPPGLQAASIDDDQATGNVVLFGGCSNTGWVSDTWVWNGTTWTAETPATSPPARCFAPMAYDQATGNLVLFGGLDAANAPLSDTWVWNGITWIQQFPATSPPARSDTSMAYDEATGNLVLFGGVDGNGNRLSDTWTWNGITWTQQSPTTSPSVRYGASMAYDEATGNLVLFGGSSNSGLLSDTWVWNGTTWTQQSPATNPTARVDSSMSYDQATDNLVLFGGSSTSGLLSDTWVWNGTTWSELSPTTSPPARWTASMTYDQATGNLVLFGGIDATGLLSDTWTYK